MHHQESKNHETTALHSLNIMKKSDKDKKKFIKIEFFGKKKRNNFGLQSLYFRKWMTWPQYLIWGRGFSLLLTRFRGSGLTCKSVLKSCIFDASCRFTIAKLSFRPFYNGKEHAHSRPTFTFFMSQSSFIILAKCTILRYS